MQTWRNQMMTKKMKLYMKYKIYTTSFYLCPLHYWVRESWWLGGYDFAFSIWGEMGLAKSKGIKSNQSSRTVFFRFDKSMTLMRSRRHVDNRVQQIWGWKVVLETHLRHLPWSQKAQSWFRFLRWTSMLNIMLVENCDEIMKRKLFTFDYQHALYIT